MASDLETLYREHYRMVFGWVLKKVHHRPTAEDITQDVFVRAAKRLDAYEDRGKPGAWLITIARNLIKDEWKSYTYQHVRPVEDWSVHEMAWDQISQWVDEREELDRARMLRSAIMGLPTGLQRKAMLLRHVEGLSVEETAGRMGLHIGAVRALTMRATRRLRRDLLEAA